MCLKRGIVTVGTEVDHIVPLSMGGDDSDENKQLLCSDCHRLESFVETRRRRGGEISFNEITDTARGN